MPLEKDMDAVKIKKYLKEDLQKSAINDISPCLNLGQDEGGYFASGWTIMVPFELNGETYLLSYKKDDGTAAIDRITLS